MSEFKKGTQVETSQGRIGTVLGYAQDGLVSVSLGHYWDVFRPETLKVVTEVGAPARQGRCEAFLDDKRNRGCRNKGKLILGWGWACAKHAPKGGGNE